MLQNHKLQYLDVLNFFLTEHRWIVADMWNIPPPAMVECNNGIESTSVILARNSFLCLYRGKHIVVSDEINIRLAATIVFVIVIHQ